MNKTGQAGLQVLFGSAIMIVLLAVVFGLGGQIIGDIGDGAEAGSALANSTDYGAETVNSMSKYLPTIGLVIVVGVIIGILAVYLYNRFAR